MEEVAGQKLFPYQVAWINDQSPYAICEKARRTGFTWAEAIASVLYCLETGQNAWFSSTDEKTGKEFIRYVKQCCEVINAYLGLGYIDLSEATTETVKLSNGSRINAISSSPTVFRGKDGRIILDEFAFHDQAEEIYTAAQGCITTKGCLRIISTHNGPGTLFFRLVEGSPGNCFSLHRTTLEDACQQGFVKKFKPTWTTERFLASVRAGCISEDAYKQEYCCEPLSLASLITPGEYDALALWDVPDELDPKQKYRPLHVGIDVGRTHDFTVNWVIEELENPQAKGEWDRYDYRTVCVKWIHNEPINVQYEIIKPILGHASISSIVIDQGTVGRTLADLILDDFPFATPITFTLPKKAELAERLKGFVQYQRISLPKHKLIRSDLLSLRREVSPGGTLRYEGRTNETHCDFAWACAMAIDAAHMSNGGSRFISTSRASSTPADPMEEVLIPAV